MASKSPYESPLQARSAEERSRQTREMFSAIAPRYDLLNHLLSLNVDRAWRRRAVDRVGSDQSRRGRYLDVCAGTYDLGLELAGRRGFEGHVVALDFALAMLRQGLPKIAERCVTPVCADALRLPFGPKSFDGAMVAFGIRNLADIDEGLRELNRILRPGGRLVILDFALPTRQPMKWLYRLYFTRILPTVGRLISKHSYAYQYLPESVLAFDDPSELGLRLETAGFSEVSWQPLSGRIACLWWGRA